MLYITVARSVLLFVTVADYVMSVTMFFRYFILMSTIKFVLFFLVVSDITFVYSFLRLYFVKQTPAERCQRDWILCMSGRLNDLGLHYYDIGNLFHLYILIKIYLFLLCRHSCSLDSFSWYVLICINVELRHVHELASHDSIRLSLERLS